jgi:predicted Zn-dependent protease
MSSNNSEYVFNNKSLIDKSTSWQVSTGNIDFGDIIVMEAGSSCKVTLNINKQLQALKVAISVTNTDGSELTDSSHRFGMCLSVKYTEDNTSKLLNEIVFPKFDYEELIVDKILSNSNIVDLGNKQVKTIEVTMFNKYEFTVIINSASLYYSTSSINEEVVSNIVEESVSEAMSDQFVSNYDQMVKDNGTYIEVRTSDPDSLELYSGRIWLREDLVN